METAKLTSWFKKETLKAKTVEFSWTVLYDVLFGLDDLLETLDSWVVSFLRREKGPPKGVRLVGPPGTGKTVAALRALRKAGLNVIERNALSTRTGRAMEDDIVHTVNMGHPNALLIEDVDSIASGQGGIETILRLVNPLRGINRPITNKDRQMAADVWTIPIICVANVVNTRSMCDLASDCLCLRFPHHSAETMVSIARHIGKTEPGLCQIEDDELLQIAGKASGDARQFVQSLEHRARTGGTSSAVDKDVSIADLTEAVFSGPRTSVSEISRMVSSDPISTWHSVQENYLLRDGVKVGEVCQISEFISDADVIAGCDGFTRTMYIPCLSSGAIHVAVNPCTGPDILPGTSWSRKSYAATRSKHMARARDLMGRMCHFDTVYAMASFIRSKADSGQYQDIVALCKSYGLDFKDVEAVLKVSFRSSALKQRHKTALKKLLPSK